MPTWWVLLGRATQSGLLPIDFLLRGLKSHLELPRFTLHTLQLPAHLGHCRDVSVCMDEPTTWQWNSDSLDIRAVEARALKGADFKALDNRHVFFDNFVDPTAVLLATIAEELQYA